MASSAACSGAPGAIAARFNDRPKLFIAPRTDLEAANLMVTLLCTGCGALVARVRDTRFGLAPTGSVCPACSHPAC